MKPEGDQLPSLSSSSPWIAFSLAGKITGLAVAPSGDACVSCSLDGSVKLFKVPFAPLEAGPVEQEVSAVLEFHGKFGFRGLDHHWRDNIFATVGERVGFSNLSPLSNPQAVLPFCISCTFLQYLTCVLRSSTMVLALKRRSVNVQPFPPQRDRHRPFAIDRQYAHWRI